MLCSEMWHAQCDSRWRSFIYPPLNYYVLKFIIHIFQISKYFILFQKTLYQYFQILKNEIVNKEELFADTIGM